ncbi:MAG: hypothetical protein ACR2J4_08280 [Deinococcus sp.]
MTQEAGQNKPSIPETVWAPLSAGALMLVVGLIGLAAHQPLLFPSLGPTAFLQVETPGSPVRSRTTASWAT